MDYGSVRLLPGWRTASGSHIVAVAVTLNEGWKTYWRAPGESGIPPTFDWTGSDNLASAEVLWPKPEVFEIFGFRTVGYRHSVVIPVRIVPRDASRATALALRFNFGACADICIPTEADFTAHLTVAPVDMSLRENTAILAALDSVPVVATGKQVRSVQCSLRPQDGGFRIDARIALIAPAPVDAVALFETGNSDLWVTNSTTDVSGRSLSAAADVENYGNGSTIIDRSALRLTLLGDGLALDIRGCPAS